MGTWQGRRAQLAGAALSSLRPRAFTRNASSPSGSHFPGFFESLFGTRDLQHPQGQGSGCILSPRSLLGYPKHHSQSLDQQIRDPARHGRATRSWEQQGCERDHFSVAIFQLFFLPLMNDIYIYFHFQGFRWLCAAPQRSRSPPQHLQQCCLLVYWGLLFLWAPCPTRTRPRLLVQEAGTREAEAQLSRRPRGGHGRDAPRWESDRRGCPAGLARGSPAS